MRTNRPNTARPNTRPDERPSLRALDSLPHDKAVAALRAALSPFDPAGASQAGQPTATPIDPDHAPLAARLLERLAERPPNSPAGYRALDAALLHWESLTKQARTRAAHLLAAHPERHLRRSPIAAARLAHLLPPNHPLAPRALAALRQTLEHLPPTAPAAAAARAALEPLAERSIHAQSPLPDDAAAALVAAVASHKHHRDDRPLAALLNLASLDPHLLARAIERIDQHAETVTDTQLALRRLIRIQHAADFQDRALAYLAHPTLAGPAITRLARSPIPANIANRWHRFIAPPRRRALHRAPSLAAAAIPLRPSNTDPDDPDARFNRLAFATIATPHASKAARERLVPFLAAHLTDPDPRTRHAAARALAGQPPSPAADRALADLAFDPDQRVAIAAATPLCRAQSPRRRRALADTLRALARSPHPTVRALALPPARTLSPEDAIDLASTDPLANLAHARLVRQRDPAAFDAAIQTRLTPHHPSAPIALRIALRLGIAHAFQNAIITLTEQASPRLIASAALALARIKPPGPDDHTNPINTALTRLLTHTSPRVRASALEALARRDAASGRPLHFLPAFFNDDTPRLRANAIHAALRSGTSLQRDTHLTTLLALDAMLNDARPAHRRSALWAAERLAHTPAANAAADALARRADLEPDPALRRRAARCAALAEHTPKPAPAPNHASAAA